MDSMLEKKVVGQSRVSFTQEGNHLLPSNSKPEVRLGPLSLRRST